MKPNSKFLHIVLWLVMILAGAFVAQAQQQVIKYPSFTIYYNPSTKIPDSVIWIASPHKKAVGREAGFHALDGRPNLSADYLHSGYDIGHNCDASDENGNKTDEYNSFDFANTFPQKPLLNRRVWLQLEDYTRQLNKPVHVKVWWSGTLGHIGKDNVTVPLYCFKEIRYDDKDETYRMPNVDTVVKHPFTYYRIK